jgi:hypothetical protein
MHAEDLDESPAFSSNVNGMQPPRAQASPTALPSATCATGAPDDARAITAATDTSSSSVIGEDARVIVDTACLRRPAGQSSAGMAA